MSRFWIGGLVVLVALAILEIVLLNVGGGGGVQRIWD
jgi:hypothetical protein